MLPTPQPGAKVSGMAGFSFKDRGKKHSLNTCESRDSASGLLRTTISTICKFSPSPGRNSVLCFAQEELATSRD